MKFLTLGLIALLAILQYRFWLAEGGYLNVAKLNKAIAQQQKENDALRERNRILHAEVASLKSGLDTLEERARTKMGMIKQGETFFLFAKEPAKKNGR